jgi:hypothetical protein
MTNSIFLARLIGPVALAFGLALALNGAVFREIAERFIGDRTLVFLAGLVTLPAFLAVLLTHNVWVLDWRLLITLIGWLGTIAGAIRVIAPQQAARMGRSTIRNPTTMKISTAVYLTIGAVLCFFGYVG